MLQRTRRNDDGAMSGGGRFFVWRRARIDTETKGSGAERAFPQKCSRARLRPRPFTVTWHVSFGDRTIAECGGNAETEHKGEDRNFGRSSEKNKSQVPRCWTALSPSVGGRKGARGHGSTRVVEQVYARAGAGTLPWDGSFPTSAIRCRADTAFKPGALLALISAVLDPTGG